MKQNQFRSTMEAKEDHGSFSMGYTGIQLRGPWYWEYGAYEGVEKTKVEPSVQLSEEGCSKTQKKNHLVPMLKSQSTNEGPPATKQRKSKPLYVVSSMCSK